MARHEVDMLGLDLLCGHDDIALILAILIIHENHHLALANILDQRFNRGQAPGGRVHAGISKMNFQLWANRHTILPYFDFAPMEWASGYLGAASGASNEHPWRGFGRQ